MSAFDDPAYRATLTPDQYEAQRAAWLRANTVETYNGVAIRTVQSRFGTLFTWGDGKSAMTTLQGARDRIDEASPQ